MTSLSTGEQRAGGQRAGGQRAGGQRAGEQRAAKQRGGEQRAAKHRAAKHRAPRHSDTGRRPSRARRRHPLRWRLLAAIVGLVTCLFGVSVVGAAMSPGNLSFEAKWADWLRSHHAALIAQQLEQFYYSATAPAKGGQPKGLNKVPPTVGATAHSSATPSASGGSTAPASPARDGVASKQPIATTAPHPPGLPPPSPIPLVVHPAVAGEGKWQATGPLVDGVPAMYVAQFRADAIYTSEITSAVWIDPKLMQLELVPGSIEPGGTWAHPPYVTTAELPRLAAAFNGGFLFQDAHGGIYLEGRQAVPLVPGAASFVIYKNGQVNIGAWDKGVAMSPNVESVLQNLVLLVNNGKLAPSATYTDNAVWGYTLGGGYVVPRSGIGITADGALVYVAGPALTAKTLAESLQRAGAVRAMTLDMNPYWVTFNFYSHNPRGPAQVTGTKLYPQMQRSADRYLPPVLEARDFFEVLLPSKTTGAG